MQQNGPGGTTWLDLNHLDGAGCAGAAASACSSASRGGIAEYFDVDPALVRIGFVLAGIFPPTSAISVIGYLLLTVILPEADAEELAGRDQLRRNLQGLRTEVEQMTESVRSNLGPGWGARGPAGRRST